MKEFDFTLDNVLDAIVDDLIKDNPEVPEFEAAFLAVQLNLTVLLQMLAMVGTRGEGLTDQELYHACFKLKETLEWMAAKQMAAQTMRQIEEM